MGAYSPPAGFPTNCSRSCASAIVAPVLRGLLAEGEDYRGVLYCGLMWTEAGPRVIEFNARFGDPETQVLMPRVGGDFARYCKSAASRYPYENTPLRGLPAELGLPDGTVAFWGPSKREGDLVSSPGGRVLTVAACGPTVAQAREKAYAAISEMKPRFSRDAPLAFRTDIARAVA
jgi:phosphoribosylamine--glycine ligase